MTEKGAIFLDRDGVLNIEIGAHITRTQDLQIVPGALHAVAKLSQAGWKVFVFTNQSGVGRGYMSLGDLNAIHTCLKSKIETAGGRIVEIYACPHHPDADCECRKPKPGMLRQAAREHGIDLTASYAVGDSVRDITAANAAGCHTALVLSGQTREYHPSDFPCAVPDRVFPDLLAFAEWLLALQA